MYHYCPPLNYLVQMKECISNWITIKNNYVKHFMFDKITFSRNAYKDKSLWDKPCNLILLLHMYHLFPQKNSSIITYF